jgi:kexin
MLSACLLLPWKLGGSVCKFSYLILLTDYGSPDLTWRDIQHLCVETARMINPEDPDWEATAQGRLYSYKYGFGVLDAYRYVKAAQDWKLVKPQAWFETKTLQIAGGTMNNRSEFSGGQPIAPGGITSKLTVTMEMLDSNNFEKLEHINVKVWIQHTKRGDVEVEIVSPKGIKSVLAASRFVDQATTGYPGWTFMSVKHW